MSPRVSVGVIGEVDQENVTNDARGIVLSGNPWDLLVRQTIPLDLVTFIYQEKVHVVTQNEYIDDDGALEEISTTTGMIGSPRLQDTQVIVRMLFEPRVQPLRTVKLKTDERGMSGPYLIKRVIHQGTVSGAVCGDLMTDCILFKPKGDLVAVAA